MKLAIRFVVLGVALASAQSPGMLTLREAMALALKQSEEAQLLTEKETRLNAVKSELWSGALPNVQLYANAGRAGQPVDPGSFGIKDSTGTPVPVFNFAQNRFSYGVEVQQPIYSFGRLGQAFHIASKQEHSLSESNRRSRQQLQLQALDAFYGAVTTAARLQVIEASLKRQNQTVGFLKANFGMGSGTRSVVLLATAALKGLEPERVRAERDAEATRMALQRLVGRSVEESLVVDTAAISDWPLPTVDTSEAGLANVVDRRPDMSSMRFQKDALRGVAKGYRMMYRPSLGVQGKWGILAYQWNEQLTDFKKNQEWQIGVGLQWQLFDGLSMSSKARQYESDARTLELNERVARSYARIEIQSAWREAVAADTAYEAAKQARDASAEASRLMSEEFRAGKGQVMDLLSAEEGLRNAEFGMVAARYQRVRSRAALRVALGMDLLEEVSK